jgi:hypothetical protein
MQQNRQVQTNHRSHRTLTPNSSILARSGEYRKGSSVMSNPLSTSTAHSAEPTHIGTFWLSFRITDNVKTQRSFDRRYEDIIQVISRHISGEYWEESSSFIIFESRSTIDQIVHDAKIAVDPRYDLFLIRRLDVKQARICGKTTDENIYKMMPYLKKV